MSKAEAQICAAREAATWYQRVEDGLTKAELSRYSCWLKASPANVEAMVFLDQLCNRLLTKPRELSRH